MTVKRGRPAPAVSAHPGHVLGRREHRAEHTVGTLAREPERLRALHAEQHGHRLGRAPLELDAIDGEDLAANRDPLAPEQAPDDRDTLAQTAEGRLERDAHLRLDPVPVTRAEPQHDAPGRDAGEGGRLHGEQRGVPRVRIHHGRGRSRGAR